MAENSVPITPDFFRVTVPKRLRKDHVRQGGYGLERWGAAVPDGMLRIMVGIEPAGRFGGKLWHVSGSIGPDTGFVSEPIRRPTNEEMAAALGLWPRVQFIEESEAGSLIRHFWQVDPLAAPESG